MKAFQKLKDKTKRSWSRWDGKHFWEMGKRLGPFDGELFDAGMVRQSRWWESI